MLGKIAAATAGAAAGGAAMWAFANNEFADDQRAVDSYVRTLSGRDSEYSDPSAPSFGMSTLGLGLAAGALGLLAGGLTFVQRPFHPAAIAATGALAGAAVIGMERTMTVDADYSLWGRGSEHRRDA